MAYDIYITAVLINLDPYLGVIEHQIEELARSHWPRGILVHMRTNIFRPED